ncbi:MAG: hypothetical protein OXC98_00385 [bacterium]|nr:hypothetical protein [Acidimicrobiia bacterium]MCY4648816.1 hypothetical protein [bacterium]
MLGGKEREVLGQQIEVLSTYTVGDVLLVDTNRTLGGQDGEGYEDRDAARSGLTFPAQLSARLMDLDPRINRVFTLSNTLTVRREGGWPPGEVERLSTSVSEFFLFYTGQ